MGKEWNIKSKRSSSIAADIKMAYSGGARVTPINLPQSILQRTTVPDNSRVYGEKLAAFFVLTCRLNGKYNMPIKQAA